MLKKQNGQKEEEVTQAPVSQTETVTGEVVSEVSELKELMKQMMGAFDRVEGSIKKFDIRLTALENKSSSDTEDSDDMAASTRGQSNVSKRNRKRESYQYAPTTPDNSTKDNQVATTVVAQNIPPFENLFNGNTLASWLKWSKQFAEYHIRYRPLAAQKLHIINYLDPQFRTTLIARFPNELGGLDFTERDFSLIEPEKIAKCIAIMMLPRSMTEYIKTLKSCASMSLAADYTPSDTNFREFCVKVATYSHEFLRVIKYLDMVNEKDIKQQTSNVTGAQIVPKLFGNNDKPLGSISLQDVSLVGLFLGGFPAGVGTAYHQVYNQHLKACTCIEDYVAAYNKFLVGEAENLEKLPAYQLLVRKFKEHDGYGKRTLQVFEQPKPQKREGNNRIQICYAAMVGKCQEKPCKYSHDPDLLKRACNERIRVLQQGLEKLQHRKLHHLLEKEEEDDDDDEDEVWFDVAKDEIAFKEAFDEMKQL